MAEYMDKINTDNDVALRRAELVSKYAGEGLSSDQIGKILGLPAPAADVMRRDNAQPPENLEKVIKN